MRLIPLPSLALLSAAPSQARDLPLAEAVCAYGVTGEWAWDCSRPPAEDNQRKTVSVSRDGVVLEIDRTDAGRHTYQILGARRLANGDVELRKRWSHDGGVVLVTERYRPGRQVVWRSIRESTGK